jgi:DNA polymerase V
VHMNDDISNVRFLGSVSAGFPSPADDYKEPKLDLNELVMTHPLSTYYMRVAGDSMVGACIYNGDVVAIDRALTATHKKIVVARLGDAFTLKRLWIMHPKMYLRAENPAFKPIEVSGHPDFEIFGVVTYVVHQVR